MPASPPTPPAAPPNPTAPAPASTPASPPLDAVHARSRMLSPPQLPGPEGGELVLRVMPMPADVNTNGDIFGGWIMAQVDLAGAVLPSRIAKGRIATVAVNEFVFKQPVSLGDLLSFYARLTRVGRTSISVHVEVYAERNPADPQFVRVTQADLTYVALDAKGQPRPVLSPG